MWWTTALSRQPPDCFARLPQDAIRMAVLPRNYGSRLLVPQVVLEVRSADGLVRRVEVDGDDFLIGRGDFCDLRLAGVDQPLVHSELHLQGGSVWIEAAEETVLLAVNGRLCRRMSLREGDRVQVGDTEITVHVGTPTQGVSDLPQVAPCGVSEDLTLLSADELCDRIVADEELIATFEQGRLSGWQSLLQAVETVLHDDPEVATHPQRVAAVAELRHLSEQLARRMTGTDVQLVNAAAEPDATQDAVSRRIEQLLQGFGESELRASA
jgi:predicted component of type VI protein secretion system